MHLDQRPQGNHVALFPLLDAALRYAARGWYVFPLYEMAGGACACGMPCGRNAGKHPRTEHGVYDATIEVAQIQHWWATWPRANLAIATGARSRLVVFDTDPRNGGDVSHDDLLHSYGAFPATPQVLTGGGGLHDYFSFDGALPTCKPAAGIDLLGDAAYVVAPPSTHASGRAYEWEASSHPDECPLAPLPDWLRVLGERKASTPLPGDPLPEVLPVVALQDLHVSTRIKFVIQTGTDPDSPQRYPSRSEALFAVIEALLGGGHDAATIAGVVLDRRYAISEKPWSQGNPKSPTYDTHVRHWITKEIARAKAKGHHAELHQRRNGHTPGPEPTDPYACPELPASAKVDATAAAEASLFLTDYIAFSQKWAPRAYAGFHETVALFVLATLAARRVKIAFGAGKYTSLYLVLAGRTGLFTKTTAADIGVSLLQRVAPYLLAADDSTPQALIRSMSGFVSPAYGDMPLEAQEREQRRLAFAAQRGWFYEEYGQHLDAMMDSHGGNMTLFRSVLRRMDDHKEHFLNETISRGVETLHKPYLTLLCNLTPMDLQPFAKKDSKLWGDGFLARFTFSTPTDADMAETEYPREEYRVPAKLIMELHNWHVQLGIPDCRIEADVDAKGKDKGTFHAIRAALPETTYTLSDEVWASYYAYDKALRALMKAQQATYLDGSYIRFPAKALRIAALLASLHSGAKRVIWPQFWARAQQITEQWRLELHRLVQQIHTHQAEPGERRTLEDALLHQARHRGAQTFREFGLFHKAHSREELAQALKALVSAGELVINDRGKATRYEVATVAIKEV